MSRLSSAFAFLTLLAGLVAAAPGVAAESLRLPAEPPLAPAAKTATWRSAGSSASAARPAVAELHRWPEAAGDPTVALAPAAGGVDAAVGSGPGAAGETGGPSPAPAAPAPAPAAAGELVASYGGIWGTGFSPSDTTLAVGPQHLVQAVNSSLAVLTRSGSVLLGPQTLASFFATVVPVSWRGILFEPQLTFSVVHDKFVLATAAIDRSSQTSYSFLAVSQTSDPTGGWWLYRLPNSYPHAEAWLAEPSLAVDAFGVYLTGNRYRWSDESFVDASLWSFGPEVTRGELASPWVFHDLRWDDGAQLRGLRAATPHSISGEAASYFVASRPEGGDDVRLLRLTGERGFEPQLEGLEATVRPYRPLGRAIDQPGTDRDLEGGGSHVADAVYVQRRVYLGLTSDPAGDGRSSALLLVGLDTADGRVRWQEELAGGDGWYYLFPGLAVAGGEDPAAPLTVVFAVVERDRLFPSIGAAVLRRQGADVLRLVKLGEGPFVDNSVLWGRRSTAVWDWFRPGRVWGSAQYAGERSFWRTENFALAIDGEERAAGPPPCLPSDTVACFQDGRFAVGIERAADPGAADGGDATVSARRAPPASDASGLFWFFSPANWEVLVKVLDGCAYDGRFWVLSAPSTAVAHELWVQDLASGRTARYPHAGAGAAPATIDTATFACGD